MKKIILLALLTFSIFAAYAQKEISEQEMKNMKNQVEAAALKFRKTLEKETKNQLSINFQLDTFRIEEMMRLRMEFDWSTSGSVQAVYDAETEYDKLLNKYYKILLGDLEETKTGLKSAFLKGRLSQSP